MLFGLKTIFLIVRLIRIFFPDIREQIFVTIKKVYLQVIREYGVTLFIGCFALLMSHLETIIWFT
jgi:hypothetical protein